MHSSLITSKRHSLRKAAIVCLVASLVVGVTYDSRVGRTLFSDHTKLALSTEESEYGFTIGTAYAQEGEGLDIGAGLDIVGGLSSFLYYAFDTSYIDKFYGGNVGGFILNFLLTGGDTTEVELDYIINQLSVINQKLNQVIKLEEKIEKELIALANEVNIDTTKGEINTVVTAMTSAICNIEEYMGGHCYPDQQVFLQRYASMTPKEITEQDKSMITSTCKKILLPKNLDSWLTTIHDQMNGVGVSSGFISLAATEVQEKVRAGQLAYQEYQVLEGYFLKYILIQSRGINLYMNCARAIPMPLIKSQYFTYLGNIVSQFITFRDAVEETFMLNSNYSLVRNAFNPWSGSTRAGANIPFGSNNILPRLDFVMDQVLGGTNFDAINTELSQHSGAFLKNARGALTARVLSAGDQNLSGYTLKFSPGPSGKGPSYTNSGTGTASGFSGLPYLQWTDSTITGNNNTYNMIRYDFPNVPQGNYEVTGPSGSFLLPKGKGEWVYLFNHQFGLVSPESRDLIVATSQTLRTWEIFTLENYHLSDQYDSALGKLKAANGKYVVADKDKSGENRLVASSDSGQDIAFVGWTKTDMMNKIINWGYLQIDSAYVNVNTQTQQISLVDDIDEATKFKITFVDKGKAALMEGKSYKVSLTYGVADDTSPVTCTHLVDPAGPCFQFYLFANVGYPYGYFSYMPLAVAGGFGKNLGMEAGGSPFSSWTFAETRNVVEGCPENGGNASADAYSDKPGVWGEITSKSSFGETCVSAGVMAANVATLRLGSSKTGSSTGCQYTFTMSIESDNSWDFQWNGQDDHYKLAHKEVFLRLDQGDLSRNPWPITTIKELSTDASDSSGSATWKTSGDLSIAKAKNGDVLSILYGLYLAYNDQGLFMSVYPKFHLDIFPSNIQLNLTGISGEKCQIGQG